MKLFTTKAFLKLNKYVSQSAMSPLVEMYTYSFKVLFNTLCLRFHCLMYKYTTHFVLHATHWLQGEAQDVWMYVLCFLSKHSPALPLVESMFNLEETQLLKRYKCVYVGMIKRLKQFWVASKLPIGQTVFGRKLYFVLGFKCAEGTEWRHPVSWGEEASRFFSSALGSEKLKGQHLFLFIFFKLFKRKVTGQPGYA